MGIFQRVVTGNRKKRKRRRNTKREEMIGVKMMVRKGRLRRGTKRRRSIEVEVDLKTVIEVIVTRVMMKLSMGRAIVIITVMNDADQGVIPSPHRENKHIALVHDQCFVCFFIESHIDVFLNFVYSIEWRKDREAMNRCRWYPFKCFFSKQSRSSWCSFKKKGKSSHVTSFHQERYA